MAFTPRMQCGKVRCVYLDIVLRGTYSTEYFYRDIACIHACQAKAEALALISSAPNQHENDAKSVRKLVGSSFVA